MNGFLVLGQCGMDNVPMRFFAQREQAYNYARTVTAADIVKRAASVLCVDVSHIVGTAVMEFCDGEPLPMDYVKDVDVIRETVTVFVILNASRGMYWGLTGDTEEWVYGPDNIKTYPTRAAAESSAKSHNLTGYNVHDVQRTVA